jgi:tetratricopeptide (TPR) repeat protein
MPHRVLSITASIIAVLFLLSGTAVFGQSEGDEELKLGLDAFGRKDYLEAVEHLARSTGALDPRRDREALAEAYLHLGLSYLSGLGRPERALPAFVKSAELGAHPESAWLWASAAAERLGKVEEAADYKARAVPPAPVVEAPAPVVPEIPREGAAFQHVFGPKEEKKPVEVKTVKEEKAPEPAPKPKEGAAFKHLFGKKKAPQAEPAKPPR